MISVKNTAAAGQGQKYPCFRFHCFPKRVGRWGFFLGGGGDYGYMAFQNRVDIGKLFFNSL